MTNNQSISFQEKEIESLKTIGYKNFVLDFIKAYRFPVYLVKLVEGKLSSNADKKIIIKGNLVAFDNENNSYLKGAMIRIKHEEVIKEQKIKYIIVYNIDGLMITDVKANKDITIGYSELHLNHNFFNWKFRRDAERYSENKTKDIEVDEIDHLTLINDFYKELKSINKTTYLENDFNLFFSKILFCLYAENTGLLHNKFFTNTIKEYSDANGEETGALIDEIFIILSLNPKCCPDKEELMGTPDHLKALYNIYIPYFKSPSPVINFNKKTRKKLISLGSIDWSGILNSDSLSVLGDMINDSENTHVPKEDILKLIKPLFLDDLYQSYKNANSLADLTKLLLEINLIKIFDPNCNSGNFLVTTYKELCLLNKKIVEKVSRLTNTLVDVVVGIDQFYGIESNNLSFNITRLSLLIAETKFHVEFIKTFEISLNGNDNYNFENIVNKEPLKVNWEDVCENKGKVYLIGKPPFIGYKTRNKIEEKIAFNAIFGTDSKNARLDYCACWFIVGAKYIANSKSKLAFVLTTDLCRGSAMTSLWEEIFKLKIKIKFAYEPFDTVIYKNITIIGLTNDIEEEKLLINYSNSRWVGRIVSNISPYLLSGPDQTFIEKNKRISKEAKVAIRAGDKFVDIRNIELSEDDVDKLLEANPESIRHIYKLIIDNDFHYKTYKYCARKDIIDNYGVLDLNFSEYIGNKIDVGRSLKENNLLIATINKINGKCLIVDMSDSRTLLLGNLFTIPNADMVDFGILSSRMHELWAKTVCHTTKDTITYSLKLGYNAFPWPKMTKEDKANIARLAEIVYVTREKYPALSFNELYCKELPEELASAHYQLDKAVEALYSETELNTDKERFLCLTKRYIEINEHD